MKRKKRILPQEGFHIIHDSKTFEMVWLESTIKMEPHLFESIFNRFSTGFRHATNYLSINNTEKANAVEARNVAKELGINPSRSWERTFALAWQLKNKLPQRMKCDPNIFRRIVGLIVYKSNSSKLKLYYEDIHFDVDWIAPEEWDDIRIMPTEYASLEEKIDEKGNKTYVVKLLCVFLLVNSLDDVAKWLYNSMKLKSVYIKKIPHFKERVAYLKKGNKLL